MQVEWFVDGGSVDIDPADYAGMEPEGIRDEILNLCRLVASCDSAYVPELDAAVAAVVEALKGK